MNERAKILTIAVSGLLLVAIAVVVVAARGGGDEELPPASGAAQAETKDIKLDKPDEVVAPGEAATVTMETTEGTFTITLDTERAPETANNFAYLTDKRFYDGLGFHRIVPGFVIQGGDPQGNGTGDPGYKVVEAPPSDLEYTPGLVAMAKAGDEESGTSGSQFFIVTGSGGSSLTPDYALVGEVTDGMDVVNQIGELGGGDEQPTRSVVIKKATLKKG
ncbi:MAG: peptidylprolyl isomerase [Actinomycetota bacterium]|nr:peptidylprolyl isomerase [Actinomycetota bacterium]